MPTYMDKTGRNGIRVGDTELSDWKAKYRALANKHEAMIDFYNVDIQYNLAELEAEFLMPWKCLSPFCFIDSEEYLYQAQKAGKSILAEGAQGSFIGHRFWNLSLRDLVQYHLRSGVCTGLGIAPNKIKRYSNFKAYATRVGSGPFPTELFDEYGKPWTR